MATEQEFNLIEKRLEHWNEKIGIANIRLGEFTKDEMLEHIKSKDLIGQEFLKAQLNYLKKLKER